jgi:nicotinamidase-related amidase
VTPEAVAPRDGWLVVIDAQAIFADPSTSRWGSPMWASVAPRVADRVEQFGPERTVFTRFVADPGLGGSWESYYADWAFALVPDGDPLYEIVPSLAEQAGHAPVVTAGTFGKWNADLRAVVGDQPHLTLAGVSTDCCVIATALPAADSGATVVIDSACCAGSTPENHQRALDAMALFGPQVTIA